MVAQIIDGKNIAKKIRQNVQSSIVQHNLSPQLDVILVGDSTASKTYIAQKQAACGEVGITSNLHHLPESTSESELAELIATLNHNPQTTGILLQLPLPKHLDADNFIEKIKPEKDVDGFHPYNLGRLAQRRPSLRPCTPYGVMQLLQSMQIETTGKNAAVIGASNIVGRPMALELLLAKSTVTICHKFTNDLEKIINNSDILVAAIGKPGVIQSHWIKSGAAVIDVGFSLIDGKAHGDIDFATAKQKAGFITPVPGGVGPMTVAALMQNTLQAAIAQHASI